MDRINTTKVQQLNGAEETFREELNALLHAADASTTAGGLCNIDYAMRMTCISGL